MGTVKGKKEEKVDWWEDNIKEWTGMDFAGSTRAAEDRTWKKRILLRHLSCPNDIARLWID